MYINNNIAYADVKAPALKVCGVRPLNNYCLWVRFNNGESKIFDFQPLLNAPAFEPLSDPNVFNNVYIDYGVPVWNNGDIDIAPETLYEKGVTETGSSC